MREYGHDQAPADPTNGMTFVCGGCGAKFEFVVLDDGLPGEWVEVTR